MLRMIVTGTAFLAITLTLIPFQWLAVALRLPSRRRIPVLYHRMLCGLLGVRIKVVGRCSNHHPLLVVANHCSWIDIPVITSLASVVFVAKHQVASWPLFGLLAKLQRTVFVNRAHRHKTAEVNAEIAQRLAEGDPVVLFGEGTSSDGNRVLPFHTALIGAARDALAASEHTGQVMIQPLSIAYVGIDGLPMGRQHRHVAAWYGDMDLMPHLLGMLRRGALDAVVSWGDPIPYDARTDRKEVARALESSVRRLTATALRSGPGTRRPVSAGHSFLPGKTLRGSRQRGGRRGHGAAQAAKPLEMRPDPERPGPISTQRA